MLSAGRSAALSAGDSGNGDNSTRQVRFGRWEHYIERGSALPNGVEMGIAERSRVGRDPGAATGVCVGFERRIEAGGLNTERFAGQGG